MTERAPREPDATPPPAVTELLIEYRSGHASTIDRLFPLVYDELHRIAHAQLGREQEGHTLNTTALVHEAYVRLVDITRIEWRDRVHFLSMAARAMRRILIDHARRHRRVRRGGGVRPVTLDEALVAADHQAETLIAIDLALDQLGSLSPRLAQVVECRFFGGMTEDETAAALQITARTVRRDWIKARGFLHERLTPPSA